MILCSEVRYDYGNVLVIETVQFVIISIRDRFLLKKDLNVEVQWTYFIAEIYTCNSLDVRALLNAYSATNAHNVMVTAG